MPFRKFGVQLPCPATCLIGLFEIGFACVEVHVEKRATVGDSSVGERILRIYIDGTHEQLYGGLHALLTELIEELPASQIVVVRLDILGLSRLYGLLVRFAQYDPQRGGNVLSNLVLNGKNVLHLTVVSLGP